MPFPTDPPQNKDEEEFECIAEMLRPVFLHTRLTDILKIAHIHVNYSFKDVVPMKLGVPGIPTIPCAIKRNYVKTALCDLGAGVSVMCFSLYRRLDLNKITPTEISLQMANKSTTTTIGICEDVHVVVANITILTDFVILDIFPRTIVC